MKFLVMDRCERCRYCGLFADDEQVGQIWVGYNRKEGSVVISNVLVFEKFRRRGYGEYMMREAVALAFTVDSKVYLRVESDNLPAINLYTKIGFQFVDNGPESRYPCIRKMILEQS